MSDDLELAERLEAEPPPRERRLLNYVADAAPPRPHVAVEALPGVVQWTTGDGIRYYPAARTADVLTPGVYDIGVSQTQGLFFERIPVKTGGLVRFPHTNSDRVLEEIRRFWTRRERFQEFSMVHKRGILLWGPPGSGKSCTIQLILEDVVARAGIAIRFLEPNLFLAGMRILREIQPDTPVVVLMEDLDSIVQRNSESEILNVLDGVELVDRAVFLATTNYPEMLGARIVNRPSRFDKRFKVPLPTAESRAIYFHHLIDGRTDLGVDIAQWVEDTEGFSIAHMKELFVAVVILDDDYNEALTTLRSMKENLTSSRDGRAAGFNAKAVLGGAMLQGIATGNWKMAE